jgi:hypothetical protein
MKAEVRHYLSGELKLEIIAETKFERDILRAAWKNNGYEMGNGQSRFDDGALGFYLDLFKAPPD